MAKSRKKKNYKLRKRVMRTIAALTMIMAVVVAAIPVENYGTLRAAGTARDINITDVDYSTEIALYSADYNVSAYENGYNSGSVTIQHVDSGVFTEVAEADTNGTNAMITQKLLSNNITTLKINGTEYYGYVRFDQDFISAVENAYASQRFVLTYDDASPQNFNGGTATVNGSSVSLPAITNVNELSTSNVINGTISTPAISVTGNANSAIYQDYTNFSGNLDLKEIYQKCWPDRYQQQQNDINAYNTAIRDAKTALASIQAKVDANQDITPDEQSRWTDLSASISSGALWSQYNSAKEIDSEYRDFQQQTVNGLKDITAYIICQTCNDRSNNNNRLVNFTLERITDEGTGTPYFMPRHETERNSATIDPNGYLASGRVTVEGIKTGAFSGSNATMLQELTIPGTVRFIGQEAFINSVLRTVTLEDGNLEIIGDRAFAECTNLSALTLGASTATNVIIDKEAFLNTAVGTLTIPDCVTKIGAGAFAGARIGTLTFSDAARTKDIEIEPCSFYNCTGLSSVSFPASSSSQYKIGKAAFALSDQNVGGSLQSFTFPGNNTAIAYSGISSGCDYILTNRTTLNEVIFPNELRAKVPDRTLAGCTNIGHVVFPENAKTASYNPLELFRDVYNEELYVEGPQYGAAGTGSTSLATARRDTWSAVAGRSLEPDASGNYTYTLLAVPYMFTDASGEVHFEIGVREDEDVNKDPVYVATVDVISGTMDAVLSKYDLFSNRTPSANMSITIPARVSRYTVVEIGEGCFGDNIRDYVYELIIQDGSVRKINARAFKQAANLQWVEIGDAVTSIGDEAFADCPKLENVVFSQNRTGYYGPDDSYWSELVIGQDAFKTNSSYLTFHGAINENYAPYALAMSADSANMTSNLSRCQICYKTDAPLNLTVIRDKATGKATLIDYPHYEEIDTVNKAFVEKRREELAKDPSNYGAAGSGYGPAGPGYSITDTFEKVNGIAGKTGAADLTIPSMDNSIVQQTLHMNLPSGIESIDAKAYFSNTANSDDFVYFNKVYEKNSAKTAYKDWETQDRDVNANSTHPKFDATDRHKLYASYEGDAVNADKETVAGLFSGYFREAATTKDQDLPSNPNGDDNGFLWYTYNNHLYVENRERGNDYLTSINLGTVEELPDFAFDSAENLKSVTISNSMNAMGQQPFRDCKSLNQINTGNSTKYQYENMILYDKMPENGDAGYKIVQGLEGRGRDDVADGDYGTRRISADTNPLLMQTAYVADYAFANNDEIFTVDLSQSNIRDIEVGTFNACSQLDTVILPERTRNIKDFAFGGTNKNFTLEVPNKGCQISSKAFMKYEDDLASVGHVTIKGIKYEDEATQDYSTAYDSFLTLEKTYGNKVEWTELGSTYTLRFVDRNWETIETIEINKGEDLRNPPSAPAVTGYKFKEWVAIDAFDEAGRPLRGAAAYSNVTENRTLFPEYEEDPSSIVPDGKDYNLTVINGKAMIGGNMVTTFPTTIKGGTSVTIMANDETNFRVWTITPGTYISLLLNPSSPATSFTMPNSDITVTANAATGGPDAPNPDGTYTVTVNNGTGSGNYLPGATVTITANAAPTGQAFANWTTTSTGITLANANTATTTFVMPSSNVTVTANYSGSGTTNPSGTYTVTVNNGTGSGQFAAGATVTITANTPNAGASFVNWTTSTTGVSFASATSSSTTFVMPASNVTVTANFSDGTGGQPGGNTTGKYKVTVNYGSGSGEYAAGETVNISAYAPESSSRVFSKWTTNNSSLGFANVNAATTSFVMPAADVTVTANYKVRTDDDDDGDSPSRRPGTNTTTTTVSNRPGSTTSTTGTNGTVNNPANGTSNNGNRIYITKNGISNTDVASVAVSGSTDNFIVRITESAEATAAVEQALVNTYGSLNGLAYLPMDISLYDSTGQNKITDTTGLNITVTMPIPDVLIQYGGNARVAAADNGVLQQITPRFTTIDGIACISFVPPHFSPYVIYVDTNNLIAGQMLDATPATGDPIHPKWFAAIGMACISILLFVMSDGRKRRKFRAV